MRTRGFWESALFAPDDLGAGGAALAAPPAAPPVVAPPAGTPPVAAPPTGTPDAASWFSGLDPAYHPAITAKGWDKLAAADVPKTLADSYFNLEKLMGADKAGKAVIPPSPDSPKSEWDQFFTKLGRPADANGYELKAPEGADPTFSKAAAEKFHELGFNKAQADALSTWYGEQAKADAEAFAARTNQEFGEWSREQGANLEKNVEMGRRAARELGFGENDPRLNAFEKAFGTKGMLEMFAKIGNFMLEAPSVGQGNSTTAMGGGLTTDSAKSRIATLQTDSAFQARLQSPNAGVRNAALAEWSKLFETAYPGT